MLGDQLEYCYSNRADNDATDMCNPDNFGGPFPLVVLLKQHTFKIESL